MFFGSGKNGSRDKRAPEGEAGPVPQSRPLGAASRTAAGGELSMGQRREHQPFEVGHRQMLVPGRPDQHRDDLHERRGQLLGRCRPFARLLRQRVMPTATASGSIDEHHASRWAASKDRVDGGGT